MKQQRVSEPSLPQYQIFLMHPIKSRSKCNYGCRLIYLRISWIATAKVAFRYAVGLISPYTIIPLFIV